MAITEGVREVSPEVGAAISARPYLHRADANIVAEAEAIRDTLHRAWVDECERRGLDANVLKSQAFEMPQWASVEAWMPTSDSRATRRFHAVAHVRPTPYHALPFEYDLTVKRGDREQSFKRLVSFSAEDARRVLGTLAEGEPLPRLRSRCVRAAPWMVWRPANKCRQIRRDWTLTLAAVVMLLWITLGLGLFGAGAAQVQPSIGAVLLLYLASGALVALFARDGLLAEEPRASTAAILFVLSLGLGIGAYLAPNGGVAMLQVASGVTASVLALQALARRPQITRTVVAPDYEPRDLRLIDSWQVLIGDLGADWNEVQMEFFSRVRHAQLAKLRHRVERVWYHSPRGVEEREQIVLEHGRSILFVHIYRYGDDLYAGWDAHLNRGAWSESRLAYGIDRALSAPTSVNSITRGSQPNTEYDLVDANTLIEWTHLQMVQVLKRFIDLRHIDQEIDFKIQRGQRQGLAGGASKPAERKNPLARLGGALRRIG
ncbi:MAG: hypothetical protein ACT4R6_01980 [Gemmatimonadaceae bacterium]